MEKYHYHTYARYQYDEFEDVRLSRKGRKLAKEIEVFLGAKPPIKNRLANRALDLAGLCGPQFAVSLTFGMSRIAFVRTAKRCE